MLDDLTTIDPVAAKKFYADVFGWGINDIEVAPGIFYTMLLLNDKPVAGLSKMPPDFEEKRFPPFWMSNVATEDVEAELAKAKELGGGVMMEKMDVMQEGVMGIINDAEQGALGLWQAKDHIGTSYKNVPGSVCRFEFGCREPEKSAKFYSEQFGWTAQKQDTPEMEYTVFMLGEEAVAGLWKLPDDMKDIPAHWLPYFMIENIDDSLDKTKSGGGEIPMDKKFAEGVGHFAVCRDPQGAVFGLLQGA